VPLRKKIDGSYMSSHAKWKIIIYLIIIGSDQSNKAFCRHSTS